MSSQTKPAFVSKQVVQGEYNFVDLAPPETNPLALVCVGRERCSPDYHLQRTGFPYFAVELIISGTWQLDCDGQSYELGPGCMFAYSPSTSFNLRSRSEDSPEKCFVDFAGHGAGKLLLRAGMTPGLPLVVMSHDSIRALIDQMLDAARYPQNASKEMGAYVLNMIAIRIEQDARAFGETNRIRHSTYARCREFIEANFLALRSIREVSGACHVDRAYLARLFKEHHKESPYQFLIRMKMEHAAKRLRNSEALVKSVAAEVGYADAFHFSRVFKKRFGLSPRNYATGPVNSTSARAPSSR